MKRDRFQFQKLLSRVKNVSLVLRIYDIQGYQQAVLDKLRAEGYEEVSVSHLFTAVGSQKPLSVIRLLVDLDNFFQILLDLKRLFRFLIVRLTTSALVATVIRPVWDVALITSNRMQSESNHVTTGTALLWWSSRGHHLRLSYVWGCLLYTSTGNLNLNG